MSMTGLATFDTTLQKTNSWLRDIMQELHSEDRQLAYSALRATLHALRDRLTVEEAVQLGAQLPMLLRGMYYEGWTPAGKPLKEDKEAFLAHIQEHFGSILDIAPARLARAVFTVLGTYVTAGELQDIGQILPKGLRELWSETVHN